MDSAMDKIEQLLEQLTLEEKCRLVAGKNMWETVDVPRLGIGSLKTTDGPAGVRGATWIDGTHTTFIPCGIALAATFDRDLVETIGGVLGAEARSKNSHVLLAPTINISRSPLGGRNFENFGEDPFLTGTMAGRYIRGVQSADGVGACMKHYVANDMETRRFNMDEQIDERTLREIYLRPFEMVAADSDSEDEADAADKNAKPKKRGSKRPWTGMAAYPKINGHHADCNTFLLQEILRKEWGYDELVMSDWGGLNDTVESIVAGTDLEMPGPPIRYGAALEKAVRDGKVLEREHLDASISRLLKLLDKAGLLRSPANATEATSAPASTAPSGSERNSDLPEFRQAARDAATGGIVLLKNEGNVLPLKPKGIKTLAIIGPNAKKPTTGGTGSAAVNPYYITNPYDSLCAAVRAENPDIEILYAQGCVTNIQPPLLGDLLNTPDSDRKAGMRVEFFAGHDFSGPAIGGARHWQNSLAFMMSDGDTPDSLKGRPHCYRASGILTPGEAGVYNLSLSSTGKAKLYLDGKLIIDNSDWSQPGGTFMNCGSVNLMADPPVVLEKGREYHLRLDNIVVPPPLRPHDNTLFHTLSGVRIGMERLVEGLEAALFSEALAAARKADVVVAVFGHNNDTEKEGVDRTSLHLPRRSDELISALCETNTNTVVVTQSASAISMEGWSERAAAVVHAWFQGQENGNALADVLLARNDSSPSGKLPITFPRRLEDHGSHPWFPGDAVNDHATYGEGVLVGYRWFDARGIVPLWPFGFGLSYTAFALTDVYVEGSITSSTKASICLTVTNTGSSYRGAEVVQVYATPSPVVGSTAAPRSLVGFTKVWLRPGQSSRVRIKIGRRAVAWYDVGEVADNGRYQDQENSGLSGRWRVDGGKYKFYVGTSSRETVAEVEVNVE